MYSRRQGISDATDAIESFKRQIAQLKQEEEDIEQKIAAIKDEKTQASQQLARGLLTDLSEQGVFELGVETGALHLRPLWQQIHQEREQWQARSHEIEQDPLFINAEQYLHPELGEWTRANNEYLELLNGTQETLDHFTNTKHFLWLKADSERPDSFGKRLHSLFTFAWLTRGRRYQHCQQALGDLPSAFYDYDQAQANYKELEAKQQQQQKQIDDLQALLDEHETLQQKLNQFPELLRARLQQELAEYLQTMDYQQIKDNIRPEAQILLSKLDALDKKIQHLSDQQESVQAEINNRQQRAEKILSVLYKWDRSNSWMLSGDKTKWLVDTTNNCARRTDRFCSAYRTQREAIVGFNNYQSYAPLFATGLVFSSFALFAADTQVDNYVAQQTYSEFQDIDQAPDDAVIDNAQMQDIIDDQDDTVMDDSTNDDTDMSDDS